MLPLVAWQLGALLVLTVCAFRGRALREHADRSDRQVDRGLLGLALALYLPFLVATNLHHAVAASVGVTLLFALFAPAVLRRVDWGLLLVFVLMFIVLRTLTAQPIVHTWLASLGLDQAQRLFVAGIAASQVVSNVPAAIALAEVSNAWRVLAIAVNVGGFGCVLGSLANLIALRLAGDRAAWREFHCWSIPFLVVVAAGCYTVMFWGR